MLFVSNHHVLCKFRGGPSVTMLSNGSILHQENRVANHLGVNSAIVGESLLQQGKKLVLIEQSYGEKLEQKRLILLKFNQDGEASEEGIFENYLEQMHNFEGYLELMQKSAQKSKDYIQTLTFESSKF